MAARPKRETFSPVDATWLRMDTPTNLMMITGVMMFDEPLDIKRVRAVIEQRLLRHERFRQRVHMPTLPLGMPEWETDPYFDLGAHIHRSALPQPGDLKTLQEMVGDLMSTPLDRYKPLWQVHVIENFGQGGAIICRLHHCIADGLALMQVLLSLTDSERDAPAALPGEETEHREGWLSTLLKPAASVMSRTVHGAEVLLHEGFETLLNPAHAKELARLGTDGVAALAKLLLTLPDRKTLFRGKCGITKRAVWTDPIPLSEVKSLGSALGSTVNDVLLAAVSGALHRYMEAQGAPADGVDIRAMVPVSLRRPSEMGTLGNRFGLVILSLPVGSRDPLERLVVLKKRMDDIKSTPEAAVAFGILNTIGLTPHDIEKVIVDIFASKVTGVMTNVPGPKESRYLAGSRLSGLMFWVPAAANLGLGISILSYAGAVIVGVATDAGLVPDPEAIVKGFHSELAEMQALVHAAAAAPTAALPASASADGRCHAQTRSGERCRNRALPGRAVCRVHDKLTQG